MGQTDSTRRKLIPRTWPLLTAAFGCLIALIALSAAGASQKAQQIYAEVSSLYAAHQRVENTLNQIQAELHMSGLYVRDYLLDPSHLTAGHFRGSLRRLRESMHQQLLSLEAHFSREERSRLDQFRQRLDSYWETLEPLFEWTPRQKLALSYSFLRREVLPRRNAVLEMAEEVAALSAASLKRQEQALRDRQREFRSGLIRILIAAVALGLLVAGVSTVRIARLERETEWQQRRTEKAEQELRLLSQQLVHAQEDERKSLSRELHDEVGQKLTALRMDLGNLERLRGGPPERFETTLAETRRLAEETLRLVRDLALGLRPSMLDDLGLGPALEWQAREFSRRSGVPVTVQLEGDLNAVSEAHRTCVYRVVQEALTNCARHARAREIRIGVHGYRDRLLVTVQDDGTGMEPDARGRGIGLIGMEERVREAGGTMELFSQPGKGTVVKVILPAPAEALA